MVIRSLPPYLLPRSKLQGSSKMCDFVSYYVTDSAHSSLEMGDASRLKLNIIYRLIKDVWKGWGFFQRILWTASAELAYTLNCCDTALSQVLASPQHSHYLQSEVGVVSLRGHQRHCSLALLRADWHKPLQGQGSTARWPSQQPLLS